MDQLPPLRNEGVFDGVEYVFVHLKRDGGRIVRMSNPGLAGTAGTVYDLLTRRMRALAPSDPR